MTEIAESFWHLPWRWADATWRQRYCANPTPKMPHASLLYRGWGEVFDLLPGPPEAVEPFWRSVLSASPVCLRRAAELMGWMMALSDHRRPATVENDPACRQALHYIQTRPLPVALQVSHHALDRSQLGVCGLYEWSQQTFPAASKRLAMMLPPRQADALAAPIGVANIGSTVWQRFWLAALRWSEREGGDDAVICSA